MSVIELDPITVELVQEGLISIVREMRANMIRTAYSSIIYEGQDFSCCLLDDQGRLIAQAPTDNPLHTFPVPWSVRAVIERFGDDINPGDVFLHNDPYGGGTHLNDVATITPVFVAETLVGYSVVRAHWGDIGGMTPGSLSGQATEIYQEGIRILPLRVISAGDNNEAAFDLIFANVRGERERRGDFRATLVSCRSGGEKLVAMAARYGLENMRHCVERLLERAEERMVDALRSIGEGSFAGETYIESTGQALEPVLVRVRLEIKAGSLTADFTGSAPQTTGPINGGPANVHGSVFTIAKSYLDPATETVNEGSTRPLHVSVPKGSFLNALPPAACGGLAEVKYAADSAVMAALASARPELASGDNKGCGNHVYIGGRKADGDGFIFYEYPAGGTGAYLGGDGNNAVRNFQEGDFSSIQPVEAIENEHPVLVEECAIRADSGGPGQWRGGFGLLRRVRLRAEAAVLSILSDRNLLGPTGVCGGESGMPNRFRVVRNGGELLPSAIPGKASGFPLQAGDVVTIETSGGGGYGDPLERELEAISSDVSQGYITPAHALRRYGAVFDDDGRLNREATEAVRRTLHEDRAIVAVGGGVGVEFEHGRRVVTLDPGLASRVGVEEGDVVELVPVTGAPLRAWAKLRSDGSGESYIELGETGLEVLGRPAGVLLRRLTCWPPAS
jgi:N-methylhydantoinase B